MSKVGEKEIKLAISISGLSGYTGHYEELGGGEINDTFKLDLGNREVVLRISKYEDQNSLHREARALSEFDDNRIPKLIFFDSKQTILGRKWIIEEYVHGRSVDRLSEKQFKSLGRLLAQIHSSQSKGSGLDPWLALLSNCKRFGQEVFLLNHPDQRLKALIHRMKDYCGMWEPKFYGIPSVMVHGDATPGNILVDGNEVYLIDWELTSHRDAMSEFATIYYEDIEFNRGKWRIKIAPKEKQALFDGYREAGGEIDEERIQFWMNHDKIGAAIFLYWRIHDSGRAANKEQIEQYQLDFDNLIDSLEKNL